MIQTEIKSCYLYTSLDDFVARYPCLSVLEFELCVEKATLLRYKTLCNRSNCKNINN